MNQSAPSAAGTATRTHICFQPFLTVNPAVDPGLDAARAGGCEGNPVAVIDVGLERGQRDGAGGGLLVAGDFRAAQSSGDADADALGAGLHRRFHALLEHAAEAGALLELLGDRLGDELRVEVRVLNLDD